MDLLPLYVDELCSEDSKKIVEEHMKDCKRCGLYYERIKLPIVADESEKELTEEEKREKEEAVIAKDGFLKIKRMWIASVCIVLLIFPIIWLGILGWHQWNGKGLCFTNMKQVSSVKHFMKELEEKDYEKAFSYLEDSYRNEYESLMKRYYEIQNKQLEGVTDSSGEAFMELYQDELQDTNEEGYVADKKEAFLTSMREYGVTGQIEKWKIGDIYYSKQENAWKVEVEITEHLEDSQNGYDAIETSTMIFKSVEKAIKCSDWKIDSGTYEVTIGIHGAVRGMYGIWNYEK